MGENAATILIPLLNQVEEFLEQAVRSALEQTVPCEVLVVTSPKTERSNLDLLDRLGAADGRIRVMTRPRAGFAAGLNHGIQNAGCERFALLLSDDWLEPNALEECLRLDSDIVCGGRRDHAADGCTLLPQFGRAMTMARYESLPDLESKARYLTHLFVFKRETVLRVGGVDETLGDSPGIDDYDLIWVLLEQGATVSIVEKPLYNYRDHEGERLTIRNIEAMTRTVHKIFDKHGIPGEQREALLKLHTPWFGRSMQASWNALHVRPRQVRAVASHPTHRDTGEPVAYLTFDDGPDPRFTLPILDILSKHGATATFFVLGQNVERHRDTLRAIVAAGHTLGNHSYSHVKLPTVGLEEFAGELSRTAQLMRAAAGDLMTEQTGRVQYMRPPYGETDDHTESRAAELGYVTVMWDVDPKDWSSPGVDVICARVLESVKPGDVILMHDGNGDRSQTVAALERILETLGARGYHCAALD